MRIDDTFFCAAVVKSSPAKTALTAASNASLSSPVVHDWQETILSMGLDLIACSAKLNEIEGLVFVFFALGEGGLSFSFFEERPAEVSCIL